MGIIDYSIMLFIIEIIIFLSALLVIEFARKRTENHRLLNLEEYLPVEEIHTLKQIFYLILIVAFFINIFYSIVFWDSDLIHFCFFDCLLSLYCCLVINKDSWRSKLLIFCLIPFGSMAYIFGDYTYIGILDFAHWLAYFHLIRIYYIKFNEYTEVHGLGISILLLFLLIFISVFVTSFCEGQSLLNSLVMSSNAFTSNGYTVLGNSIFGKIDSLFLIWGGYILSGVGTATLTAGIVVKHFNKRFDELENLIKKDE